MFLREDSCCFWECGFKEKFQEDGLYPEPKTYRSEIESKTLKKSIKRQIATVSAIFWCELIQVSCLGEICGGLDY